MGVGGARSRIEGDVRGAVTGIRGSFCRCTHTCAARAQSARPHGALRSRRAQGDDGQVRAAADVIDVEREVEDAAGGIAACEGETQLFRAGARVRAHASSALRARRSRQAPRAQPTRYRSRSWARDVRARGVAHRASSRPASPCTEARSSLAREHGGPQSRVAVRAGVRTPARVRGGRAVRNHARFIAPARAGP